MGRKIKILVFNHYYLPGYKSGGPIRSLANMAECLGDEFDFQIVTSDRDALDQHPYPAIKTNDWNQVDKAKVYYASPLMFFVKTIFLLRKTEFDILYLNSFFDVKFTVFPLLMRWLKVFPQRPVVVAPRGEFSPGALILKSWKKNIYIVMSRVLGLYRDVVWQASSDFEAKDIERVFEGTAKNIVVAPNLPSVVCKSEISETRRNGPLKILFLSRISPTKNLDYALRILMGVEFPVVFTIAGPVRDKNYWNYCKSLIDVMPPNIQIKIAGSVDYDQVSSVMAANDLFFLPMKGENFGHVILEAMMSGTPVLISNTTPWRHLTELKVGWDIPLEAPENFVGVLNDIFEIPADEYMVFILPQNAKQNQLTITDNYGRIIKEIPIEENQKQIKWDCKNR